MNAEKICPNCNQPTDSQKAFCKNCGFKLFDAELQYDTDHEGYETQSPGPDFDDSLDQRPGFDDDAPHNENEFQNSFNPSEEFPERELEPDGKNIKSQKKLIVIICCVAALAVIFGVLAVLLWGGSNDEDELRSNASDKADKSDGGSQIGDENLTKLIGDGDGAVVIRDGLLHYYNCKSGKFLKLSDTFIKENDYYQYLCEDITITDNNRYLYYLADIVYDEYKDGIAGKKANLYRLDLSEPDLYGYELILEDIGNYIVVEGKSTIVYEVRGKLYEYDLKTKASELVDEIDGMYDVVHIGYSGYAYISKEGSLYAVSGDGKPSLIMDNVSAIYKDTQDASFFFETPQTLLLPYADFVEHDVEFVNQVPCPVEPKAPVRDDFESDEAYENAGKAYEDEMEAYDEEYADYLASITQSGEASQKEILWDELQNEIFDYHCSTIYKYDFIGTHTLAEYGSFIPASDGGGLVCAYETEFDSKLKLSEISSIQEVNSFINDSIQKVFTCISGDDDKRINYNFRLDNVVLSDNMRSAIGFVYNDGKTDIYLIDVRSGIDSDATPYAENIIEAYFTPGESVVYAKEVADDPYVYDYYINGNKVTESANMMDVSYFGDFLCVENIKEQGQTTINGSLVLCYDGEKTTLARGNIENALFIDSTSVAYSVLEGDDSVFYFYCDGKTTELGKNIIQYTYFYGEKEEFMYITEGKLFALRDGEVFEIADDADYFSMQ